MLINKGQTKTQAAAKAGMDIKTARKYLKSGELPCESKPFHNWRTRNDPFEKVWPQIKEMLEFNSRLEAKTIFEHLKSKYPSEYNNGQLRTLRA